MPERMFFTIPDCICFFSVFNDFLFCHTGQFFCLYTHDKLIKNKILFSYYWLQRKVGGRKMADSIIFITSEEDQREVSIKCLLM